MGFFLRWLHVMAGVMWIGLLWYFNFVQTPTMPKIEPAEHRAAISKYIAPTVLFWFRYAALATVVTRPDTGLHEGLLVQALTLPGAVHAIGIGMWLALIMGFNVWFIIWPNQKKVLGIVDASAEEKAAAGRWPAWPRASTPCCRSRCCIAWWRSRTAASDRHPDGCSGMARCGLTGLQGCRCRNYSTALYELG